MRRATRTDQGFTLTELLVVVVIIGILVAIAIPVYLNYKRGAREKTVLADVRSATGAVEAYYATYGRYPDSSIRMNLNRTTRTVALGPDTASGTFRINLSDETYMTYWAQSITGPFKVCATTWEQTRVVVLYDSVRGGSPIILGHALDDTNCAGA